MRNIKFIATGHGRGEVFIDDVRVPDVCGVKIFAGVDNLNRVTIELAPKSIEAEGEFEADYVRDTTTMESNSREFRQTEKPN